MNGQNLAAGDAGPRAEVLDHAAEFVEVVYRQAPVEYQRLISSERFQADLARGGGFNYGKLYVYAEFKAFRREFGDRFPGASGATCINAFSGLFLKNDISINNLLDYVEGHGDSEQLQLENPERT